MNRTFHPFRAPTWNGFKRFIEWRNRALIRHELRMSRSPILGGYHSVLKPAQRPLLPRLSIVAADQQTHQRPRLSQRGAFQVERPLASLPAWQQLKPRFSRHS
jgi:hypothetical protein